MCLGSAEAGWIAFVRHVPPDVPRIYLCDTFCDERCEARAAAQARAEAVHGGAWRCMAVHGGAEAVGAGHAPLLQERYACNPWGRPVGMSSARI